MRIIFMGTPDFSVPTLKSLIESKHEVIAAVTQPDKPKGRGKTPQFSPVKQAALEAGIPIFQPVKVREKEFIETLKELRPDVIIVVAFGQILPKDILDMPVFGCINVHASLLPKYRGAAPIQWVILEGEKETGVTAMYMDVGLDTGDMLKKVTIPIDKKETGESLHDKLSVLGGSLILEVLEELENGTAVRIKQEDEKSSYAKMLTKEMGHILWEQDAVTIERLIRGLNAWPSAYTHLNGKTLKIWDAQVLEKEYKGDFGMIVKVEEDRLLVKTGKGTLAVREVQLEGKKRMKMEAFLRGYTVKEGTIFS